MIFVEVQNNIGKTNKRRKKIVGLNRITSAGWSEFSDKLNHGSQLKQKLFMQHQAGNMENQYIWAKSVMRFLLMQGEK